MPACEGGAEVTMTGIARKIGSLGVVLAVLIGLGCGGRTSDEDEPGNPSGTGQPNDTPVPSCNQICRRAVDKCVPGAAVDQCVKDCEGMRSDYMGCQGLDKFLRCNLTAPVLCTERVVFDGCYEERNDLVRCKSL
jgi:hypothetical protein